MINIDILLDLKKKYGESMTLGRLADIMHIGMDYKCPSCSGKGQITKYRPSWRSNEGEPDIAYTEKCPYCNGYGWTKKELKPRMVQKGWE